MVKALVDKMSGARAGGHGESEVSSGMLYSTGLVAGGSLTGVLIAILSGQDTSMIVEGQERRVSLVEYVVRSVGIQGWQQYGAVADLIGIAFFAGLCILLLKAARQRLEA